MQQNLEANGAFTASDPTANLPHRPVYVQDTEGQRWSVRFIRPTKHGFNLYLGHRAASPVGSPSLIATRKLVSYWEAHRTDFHANFDLPASPSAISRLRHRLGFNVFTDRRKLWTQPIADLKNLPVCQFADLYNIPISTAIRWRVQLLTNLSHPRRRAQDPVIRQLLLSDLRHRQVAEVLGINTSSVHALRQKLCLPADSQGDPSASFPAKWRTPEVFAVLRSGGTAGHIARQLGISDSHALRLRNAFRLLSDQSEIEKVLT